MARKPRMLVTVALANKMVRIIWALLVKAIKHRVAVRRLTGIYRSFDHKHGRVLQTQECWSIMRREPKPVA
ncbi:hypothetical protein SAMN02745223_03951 [Devosia limi DSM 17137]|nr:hypothetical protein SAMN02745223_03951 [Devosia limi DSM 17137]